MAEKDILDEIEKKSKDILDSNEQLAERLEQNKATIARFSDEFDSLKKEIEQEGAGPGEKERLASLKAQLEEKKGLIANMIDDLKPVEVDMSRREDLVTAMKQRVEDQSAKIESLSKDLLDNRKRVQQFMESNVEFRKKMVEKDSIIEVLNNKLAEKATSLKDVDARNSDLEQQVASLKKHVFSAENKAGAIEKRVFATNDQNQKLLYELMQLKERLKGVDAVIADRDRQIDDAKAKAEKDIETLRKDEEEKKVLIMKNHSKKMAVMNATIDMLKARLEKSQELIDRKSAKEQNLMAQFSKHMKELMETKISTEELNTDVDLNKYKEMLETPDIPPEPSIPEPPTPATQPEATIPMAPETSYDPEPDMAQVPAPDAIASASVPSRLHEIIPMIESAMDHGDNLQEVRTCLKGSGFRDDEIQRAFSKLHIIEN